MVRLVLQRRSAWWAQRSAREKWLLLVAAALLAITLAWLLVIRPLGDASAAAQARLDAAVTELGKARGQAAALTQAPGSQGEARPAGPPVPLPIDGYLMQAAAEAGFTGLQVTASGADRAGISIANVRPQPFLAWLAELQARGLVVENLSARANQDQTVAVQAMLRAGRR